jgi:hypothetical protein
MTGWCQSFKEQSVDITGVLSNSIGDMQPCFGAAGDMASICIGRSASSQSSALIHSVVCPSRWLCEEHGALHHIWCSSTLPCQFTRFGAIQDQDQEAPPCTHVFIHGRHNSVGGCWLSCPRLLVFLCNICLVSCTLRTDARTERYTCECGESSKK